MKGKVWSPWWLIGLMTHWADGSLGLWLIRLMVHWADDSLGWWHWGDGPLGWWLIELMTHWLMANWATASRAEHGVLIIPRSWVWAPTDSECIVLFPQPVYSYAFTVPVVWSWWQIDTPLPLSFNYLEASHGHNLYLISIHQWMVSPNICQSVP